MATKLADLFERARQRVEEKRYKKAARDHAAGKPVLVPPKPTRPSPQVKLPAMDEKVIAALGRGNKTILDLQTITGHSKFTLRSALVRLILRGIVVQGPARERPRGKGVDRRGRRQFTFRLVEQPPKPEVEVEVEVEAPAVEAEAPTPEATS